MGRRSFSAEILNRYIEERATKPKASPVLRFQWVGLAHQPPAGDQTW